jgi:hypothetical protein
VAAHEQIAKLTLTDSSCERAEDEFWDAILVYSYANVDHIIESLQRSFANNQVTFDDLVTKMFGISDANERGSRMDRVLGDRIIALHHLVRSYDKSMRELHTLIHFASDMNKEIEHLPDRLRYLLQKAKFSNELHELIRTLGFPERAYSTFIKAAKTSPAFTHTTLHTVPSSSSPRGVYATVPISQPTTKPTFLTPKLEIKQTAGRTDCTPLKTTKTPSQTTTGPVCTASPQPQTRAQPPRPQQSTKHEVSKVQGRTASTPLPQKSLSTPHNNIEAIIRPYLDDDDQNLGLPRLQPASKQAAARLVGAILRGQLLPTPTNAWYVFGFVATRTEEEERHLGGLYLGILRDAQDRQSIFRDIVRAVETNTLVDLINTQEYGRFQDIFPGPASFLNTPPEDRSTVWRLKQFVADQDNTEPPPHLQRDYGFKYCRQREEIQRLKDIYWNILKKANPMDLHHACVFESLYKFASMKGFATTHDRRLMQNDGAMSSSGLENREGLQAYLGPFFKRRL